MIRAEITHVILTALELIITTYAFFILFVLDSLYKFHEVNENPVITFTTQILN